MSTVDVPDGLLHRTILGRCYGAAVAQEVRAVVWQQEGCWFDPRALPRYVSRCP